MTSQRKPRAKRRTPALWRALFAEQARSGLSVKAFCAQRGIGYSTFARWKSALSGAEQTAPQTLSFIELSPPQSPSNGGWDVELTLGPDIILRLAHH